MQHPPGYRGQPSAQDYNHHLYSSLLSAHAHQRGDAQPEGPDYNHHLYNSWLSEKQALAAQFARAQHGNHGLAGFMPGDSAGQVHPDPAPEADLHTMITGLLHNYLQSQVQGVGPNAPGFGFSPGAGAGMPQGRPGMVPMLNRYTGFPQHRAGPSGMIPPQYKQGQAQQAIGGMTTAPGYMGQ